MPQNIGYHGHQCLESSKLNLGVLTTVPYVQEHGGKGSGQRTGGIRFVVYLINLVKWLVT